MPDPAPEKNAIEASRRWITILFTDVVDSTRHWHDRGDIDARYRIEQHDGTLIPLVAAYDGRVVKTIGDSIMARFEDPENAVRAAIAMQHALHEMREKDPDFELKVRIGIHRGKALVEDDDVYGNSVNVAARVESEAQGDEILISGAVAQELDQERYYLSRRGSFTPRGKTNSILLYRVSWWRADSLVGEVPRSRARVRSAGGPGVQFVAAVAAGAVNLAGVAALFFGLAPAVLGAYPGATAYLLNPAFALEKEAPAVAAGAAVSLLFAGLIALASRGVRRGSRASALGWLAAAAVLGAAHDGAIEFPALGTHEIAREGEEWIEIIGPSTPVRANPASDARVLDRLEAGHRALLDQRAFTRRGDPWLRVTLGPAMHGWLPDTPGERLHRWVPAHIRTLESRHGFAALGAALVALLAWLRTRT